MENRINKKINAYLNEFKTKIIEKINNKDEDVCNFIYNYDKIECNKEDFMKRRRVKNTVPTYDRCIAKKALGDQCSRKKREGLQYCGTHSKGTPHGLIQDKETINNIQKVEVFTVEINGIVYYIDDNSNVYDSNDILYNNKNPKIIANYEKNEDIYIMTNLTV